jgi:purine-binding chemotaxis protein CheW
METQRLFCTFRVAGRLFGVDILEVKEITAETAHTRIAHTPDEVLGLVNIRGYIYLALDLRRLLGLPALPMTAESRLVLFKPAVGSAFGVVVDEIAEITTVATNRIEPFTQNDHDGGALSVRTVDLVESVCKLDSALLVVLNPRRFLAVVEQKLAASASSNLPR